MSTLQRLNTDNPFAYMDIIPLSILVSDLKDGNIVYANREYGKVFGYDPKMIKGDQVSSLYQNPDEWSFVLRSISETGRVNNHQVLGKDQGNNPCRRWNKSAALDFD